MDASVLRGARVIDLTQMYEPEIPCPPGQPAPRLQVLARKERDDAVNAEAWSLGLHTGTHVDAPFHFYSELETIQTVVAAPDRLIGRGVVVDMSGKHGWEPVDVQAIHDWEHAAGVRIDAEDIVMLRSDHGRNWQTGVAGTVYLEGGWPYLTEDAARYLAGRRIKALGVECIDPDHMDVRDPSAATWPAHHIFLRSGVLIIENLCHLDEIGSPTCLFIGLPLRIRYASAAPLRAIAVV
jgi:kynurenine formamidase